jgi:muramidase (phage lysozyme)
MTGDNKIFQIELFLGKISTTWKFEQRNLKEFQDEMNNFLKTIDKSNVKNIKIILGEYQKLGIIEYITDPNDSPNKIVEMTKDANGSLV